MAKLSPPVINFGEEQPLSAVELDRLKLLEKIPGNKITGKTFEERLMLQNRKQAYGTSDELAPFGNPTNFDHHSEHIITGEEDESTSSGRSHTTTVSTSGLVQTKIVKPQQAEEKEKEEIIVRFIFFFYSLLATTVATFFFELRNCLNL